MHTDDRKSWYERRVESSGADADIEVMLFAVVVDAAICSERGYTCLDQSNIGLLDAL